MRTSEIRRPVDLYLAPLDIHALQVGRRGRQPLFVLTAHHHQRPRRRLQKVLQGAQNGALGIAHREAEQIIAVVLMVRG